MTEPVRLDGYRPGDLAAVIALHMAYYAPEWGLGRPFETKLAGEMGEFLHRMDPERDLFLAARSGETLVGSISLDVSGGGAEGAHLRWFVVGAKARGSGLGHRLLKRAMDHCDTHAEGRCWLTTFGGLDAARHLYEAAGFRLVRQAEVDQWQGGVREQLFLRP